MRLPPASCFFESSKACRNCANVNDDGGFAGIVSFLCVSCRRQREAGAVGCANKGPLPHTTGVGCTPRSAGHATGGPAKSAGRRRHRKIARFCIILERVAPGARGGSGRSTGSGGPSAARRLRLPPASCFFESSKACRNCANVNDDGGFAGIVSFLCVSCRRQREGTFAAHYGGLLHTPISRPRDGRAGQIGRPAPPSEDRTVLHHSRTGGARCPRLGQMHWKRGPSAARRAGRPERRKRAHWNSSSFAAGHGRLTHNAIPPAAKWSACALGHADRLRTAPFAGLPGDGYGALEVRALLAVLIACGLRRSSA